MSMAIQKLCVDQKITHFPLVSVFSRRLNLTPQIQQADDLGLGPNTAHDINHTETDARARMYRQTCGFIDHY